MRDARVLGHAARLEQDFGRFLRLAGGQPLLGEGQHQARVARPGFQYYFI